MIRYEIERALPAEIQIRNRQRYLVEGWIFGPARLRRLALVVNGRRFEPEAREILRQDVKKLWGSADAHGWALFSGFAIPVVLDPVSEATESTIMLEADFRDGERFEAKLGSMRRRPWVSKAITTPLSANTITICMATYNPDLKLFERQVRSISEQDYRDWICIVCDDGSKANLRDGMRRILASDSRFILIEHNHNLGFYHNFERALEYVPSESAFVALSDQDDFWYPGKLRTCLERLRGTTQLVFCDMRVVDKDGALISPTFWKYRTYHYRRDQIHLLALANTVTGAACVFRRQLLDLALPFPLRYGDIFHDNWLAVLAAGNGGIAYVDEPLFDYVQTGANVCGFRAEEACAAARLTRDARYRPSALAPVPLMRKPAALASLVADFAGDRYLMRYQELRPMLAIAQSALARGVDADAKARLRQMLGFLGTLSIAWRNRKSVSTLGRERLLAATWLADIFYRASLPALRIAANSGFFVRARQGRGDLRTSVTADDQVAALGAVLSGAGTRPADRSPFVNILITEPDTENFLAGCLGMYNLAQRFASLGKAVRLVFTNRKVSGAEVRTLGDMDPSLRDFLATVRFTAWLPSESPLDVFSRDVFVATSSWTAHRAAAAVAASCYQRFIYFSQQHESLFLDHGSLRAVVDASYKLDYIPLVSTEVLRQYYLKEGILPPRNPGFTVNNPVRRFEITEAAIRSSLGKRRKRLLFYACTQPHAAPNLFAIGCLAIDRACQAGHFSKDDWDLIGIGAEKRIQTLPSGRTIEHLGRLGVEDYRRMLPDHDVGLALMYSPHPGFMPMDMAAAGLMVVTNTYRSKSATFFETVSPNIIGVEPTVDALAAALALAAERASDIRARAEGSNIAWPSSWEEALPDSVLRDLLEQVENSIRTAEIGQTA